MRLVALGSGSRGNAFALQGRGGTLLLDAGLSAREWLRRAATVGLESEGLVGIALTHEHGDHAAGAVRLARRFRVPIVATEGTLRALGVRAVGVAGLVLRGSSIVEIGPFAVSCCRVLHDAAEPAALVVEGDARRVGLAYDFGRPTMALRYLLRDLDAIVLEANYDEVMLRTSGYPASVQHRIAGSGGHLSNTAACDLLGELLHRGLSAVVLAHLSQQCNDPGVARAVVEAYLRRRGFRGVVAVAQQDIAIEPIQLPLRPGAAQVELAFEASGSPSQDPVAPGWNPAAESEAPPVST